MLYRTSRDAGRNESGRGGVTLIEVLVVFAILGLLVSLLMPAVLRVREAARLTGCENHFKELTTGLHNFEETHRALPPSYVAKNPALPEIQQRAFGWGALILSHIGQGTLFKELQPNATAFPTSPTRLTTTRLEVMVCPSDTGEPIIERLKRTATSQNPRRRALLFAGRDYLKRLVTEERFRKLDFQPGPMNDDSEQRYRQNMATFDGTVLASTAMLTPAQGEGPMLTPMFGDPSRKP